MGSISQYGNYPDSYREFLRMFPDDATGEAFLFKLRWHDGFICRSCSFLVWFCLHSWISPWSLRSLPCWQYPWLPMSSSFASSASLFNILYSGGWDFVQTPFLEMRIIIDSVSIGKWVAEYTLPMLHAGPWLWSWHGSWNHGQRISWSPLSRDFFTPSPDKTVYLSRHQGPGCSIYGHCGGAAHLRLGTCSDVREGTASGIHYRKIEDTRVNTTISEISGKNKTGKQQ